MVICGCINDCITDVNPKLSFEQASSLIQSVRDCHNLAKQTVDLCTTTLTTGSNLVECGESIHSSLLVAATDINAESFAVIADLIDGDKAREARDLAVSMKDKSSECISLSKQMVDSLEISVKKLPDWFENYIEKKAHQSVTEELSVEERSLEFVDDDVNDLSDCIDAIKNLKLLTAMEVGKRAFNGIAVKSQHCHKIFQMIKKFATNLASLTEDFINLDASAIISKRKDIYTAIGLSSIMKSFAESCQSLMEKVVQLFQGAAGKLSQLWKALSHAKDVMVDSLHEVVDAKSFCEEAKARVKKLREVTDGLETKSRGATSLNKETLVMLKALHKGEEFNEAMSTARGLDDEVAKAVSKMKSAARKVKDEYDNLPPMITDGIIDSSDDEVNSDELSKLQENERNIQDLQDATTTVKDANVMDAAREIHDELSKLPSKIDVCEDMIGSCFHFSERSQSSIDSFLGKWTLESAVSNMQQMCKLANLSKLMEQFAAQIQELLVAIIELFKTMMKRIRSVVDQAQNLISLSSSGDGNGLDSVVDYALDAAGDLVSDGLSNIMGKMLGK